MGERVRLARVTAGLTQEELAAAIGVAIAVMRAIETGRRFDAPILAALLQTLGIRMSFLFTNCDDSEERFAAMLERGPRL